MCKPFPSEVTPGASYWSPVQSFNVLAPGTVIETCGPTEIGSVCHSRPSNGDSCFPGVVKEVTCVNSDCTSMRLRCQRLETGAVDESKCYWAGTYISDPRRWQMFFPGYYVVGAKGLGHVDGVMEYQVCKLDP